MLIAQITDFHLKPRGRLALRRVDTIAGLEAAVAQLARLDPEPDVIVATGDLVDAGTVEEYAVLRDLLAPLSQPVLLIPGNHDRRAPLRAVFHDHFYLPRGSEFLHWVVEDFPVRIVGLDSLVEGAPHGRLCPARLEWLADRLAERPEAPTLLLVHHPPFATGIGHMDAMGLDGADGLAEILGAHRQVERILCGHLHRPIQALFAGTLASTAPSTAHQVALDLRPGAPASFTLEPPGYQLHQWGAAGFVSHTAPIGDFPGPFLFG